MRSAAAAAKRLLVIVAIPIAILTWSASALAADLAVPTAEPTDLAAGAGEATDAVVDGATEPVAAAVESAAEPADDSSAEPATSEPAPPPTTSEPAPVSSAEPVTETATSTVTETATSAVESEAVTPTAPEPSSPDVTKTATETTEQAAEIVPVSRVSELGGKATRAAREKLFDAATVLDDDAARPATELVPDLLSASNTDDLVGTAENLLGADTARELLRTATETGLAGAESAGDLVAAVTGGDLLETSEDILGSSGDLLGSSGNLLGSSGDLLGTPLVALTRTVVVADTGVDRFSGGSDGWTSQDPVLDAQSSSPAVSSSPGMTLPRAGPRAGPLSGAWPQVGGSALPASPPPAGWLAVPSGAPSVPGERPARASPLDGVLPRLPAAGGGASSASSAGAFGFSIFAALAGLLLLAAPAVGRRLTVAPVFAGPDALASPLERPG
jgi:hypothetical protein